MHSGGYISASQNQAMGESTKPWIHGAEVLATGRSHWFFFNALHFVLPKIVKVCGLTLQGISSLPEPLSSPRLIPHTILAASLPYGLLSPVQLAFGLWGGSSRDTAFFPRPVLVRPDHRRSWRHSGEEHVFFPNPKASGWVWKLSWQRQTNKREAYHLHWMFASTWEPSQENWRPKDVTRVESF